MIDLRVMADEAMSSAEVQAVRLVICPACGSLVYQVLVGLWGCGVYVGVDEDWWRCATCGQVGRGFDLVCGRAGVLPE